MNSRPARIVYGVRGPSGESGVLLLVPPSEALDWDLQDEVASTARFWIADRQAWWVATPYASTGLAIATRFNAGRPPLEEFASPSPNGGAPVRRDAKQALQRVLRRLGERLNALLAGVRIRARKRVRQR